MNVSTRVIPLFVAAFLLDSATLWLLLQTKPHGEANPVVLYLLAAGGFGLALMCKTVVAAIALGARDAALRAGGGKVARLARSATLLTIAAGAAVWAFGAASNILTLAI